MSRRPPSAALLALALLLLGPTAARAADPIMPLGDVRSGMRCTGYSVVRGTDVATFDVEVLEVVDDSGAPGSARILVRTSGPAVDATGIGPGFSGSPILCPDAAGVARNIGAISESIGEYGGAVVLAQPIQAILGTPVDPPRARSASRLLARARPLRSPLAVTGLSAGLGRALGRAGARAGRPMLAVPAGPLGSFPVQTLRPGSAMAVGYASGDISAGAIGTVSYTDGGRVWGFGHPFEGAGARALLLQDAYVFRVVANPNVSEFVGTSYKLAAPGHDVGTLTSDGASAVAGRLGRLPSSVPVRVGTTDEDTGERQELAMEVPDETDLDFPTGPNVPFFAPLALAESVIRVLRSAPPRVSGSMCARIRVRERSEPLRFCNRYVAVQGAGDTELPGFAGALAEDLNAALEAIDDYAPAALHMTEVRAEAHAVRGDRSARLRRVVLPSRITPGQRVRIRLLVDRRRAGTTTLTVPWTVPRGLAPGQRRLTFSGEATVSDERAEDTLEEELAGDGSDEEQPGPRSLAALVRRVEGLARYDGVVVRAGGRETRLLRHPELQLTGRARATVRIARRSRQR